jgi:hypothetical protein
MRQMQHQIRQDCHGYRDSCETKRESDHHFPLDRSESTHPMYPQ